MIRVPGREYIMQEHESQSGAPQSSVVVSNALVIAAVTLCYFFTTYRMDENAQTFGVICLLVALIARPMWTTSAWLWVGVLGSLVATIVARPTDVPNHHFMLSYIALAMVLICSAPGGDRAELMMRNARWMLVVLMCFATVQKVCQPTFRDGSYMGYEITRGGFAGPTLFLFGDVDEVTSRNDQRIKEFRQAPPSEVSSVQLEPPVANLPTVSRGFALATIAVELLLLLGFLFAPSAVVSHLLLLSFIISLGVLRQELTFISVVSALGLMATSERQTVLRGCYTTLAILCAAGILKTFN